MANRNTNELLRNSAVIENAVYFMDPSESKNLTVGRVTSCVGPPPPPPSPR